MQVIFEKVNDKGWGVKILNEENTIFDQNTPFELEIYKDGKQIKEAISYSAVKIDGKTAKAEGLIRRNKLKIRVNDRWTIQSNELILNRDVKIEGSEDAGFMTALNLNRRGKFTRAQADFFVPGMIYGDPTHLTRTAIGGVQTKATIFIREDRMPVPLFAALFDDGSSVTVCNPSPLGNTTQEDSEDSVAKTLIDNRFRFGSLGVDWGKDSLFQIGYKYPGSEGEDTYAGNTYPDGQMKKWRLRYHKLDDGFEQKYSVIFRFTNEEKDFAKFYSETWNWAWNLYDPGIYKHDIAQVKRVLLDMLGKNAISKHGRTGYPQSIMGAKYEPYDYENKATLGFVGKNMEAAYFLLRDGQEREDTETGKNHRKLANDIINTFIKLPVAPPNSEGYDIDDGSPRFFGEGVGFSTVFLRSYCDDMKSLLKAIKFERQNGREHPEWLSWVQEYGDWLLTFQNEKGGFPRSWDGKTGKVIDSSCKTSYNPIPMYLLLSELTKEEKYKQAALKAGNFAWEDGQNKGVFVGATIDNPDVIDKEAGTLSLEAYLALYNETKDEKWIYRAKAAADFAETWIYLWEVPIPDDNNDKTIGLKKGMTTIGNQLISTGHSLTDNYMAFDVDEFVELSRLTGNDHYMDVARILLHNTKSWISIPEHPYDLKGMGWVQEHWSLAPHRGHGMHRRWLPWVTTSYLNGIFGLQDIDEDINLDVK
ncbi:MAG: hypothetical protein IH594_07455 [Bacteroidales bacterium]|nr:hypothetical protein [Bacteroidales bacterium]